MKPKRKAEPDSPAKSTTPNRKRKRFPVILPDRSPACTEVMVLFRIISRRDWDRLQGWHRSCPGSEVEHLYAGLYVLTIPAGGAGLAA